MAKKNTRRTSYQRRSPKKQSSSRLSWLVVGVLIGALFPGYLLLKSSSSGSQEIVSSQGKIQDVVNNPHLPLTQAIAKKIHPKRENSAPHNNYEFYNLLSSSEEETGLRGNNTHKKVFSINIAALKNFDQADQVKAQLALIGIENVAIVKSVQGYNVTCGPYATKQEASKLLKQLKENDLSGNMVEKDG